MTKEQIQIGQWIIWDEDTYPHPRQIMKKQKSGYVLSGLRDNSSPYKKGENEYIENDIKGCQIDSLLAARLCREDEIPEQFKKLTYEIY